MERWCRPTLYEALFLLLKRDWSKAWRVPLWVLQGRAVVKQKLGALRGRGALSS
jgi:hypothetical protein